MALRGFAICGPNLFVITGFKTSASGANTYFFSLQICNIAYNALIQLERYKIKKIVLKRRILGLLGESCAVFCGNLLICRLVIKFADSLFAD